MRDGFFVYSTDSRRPGTDAFNASGAGFRSGPRSRWRFLFGAPLMRGFRGKVRIPCANNRCMVIRDGKEIRSEMILVTETRMGRLLDEPFYRCEREGCWYRDNPIAVTEGNFSQFVTEDYRWKRRGEKPGQNVPEAVAQ